MLTASDRLKENYSIDRYFLVDGEVDINVVISILESLFYQQKTVRDMGKARTGNIKNETIHEGAKIKQENTDTIRKAGPQYGQVLHGKMTISSNQSGK